jgi:hypothetical protein
MARKHTDRHEDQKIQLNNAAKQKDDKRDEDFPGYPHYNKKEDIMDGRSDTERVSVDIESLPSFHNATTSHRLNPNTAAIDSPTDRDRTDNDGMDTDLGIEMGTEADVSAEERIMLEDDMYYPTQDEDRLRQARLDDSDFDGEKLNEESFGAGQAESGSDLDMDSNAEETVSHATEQDDEENQYWSLGGGENDNIVEGTP